MLTIIRGLPGSGKSTLAQTLADQWAPPGQHRGVHIEADQYFMEHALQGGGRGGRDGVYTFDATKLPQAHADCMRRTREALLRKRAVYVSNTFTTLSEYLPYLKLADELGIPVQVIECHGNFGSVHDIPDATLQKMRARWEPTA